MEDDDYKYLHLKDALLALGQYVNLIAIVSDATPPRPANNSDFFCTLKIVDDSCSKVGSEVRVVGGSESALPRVKSVGDMMRCSVVFNKKRSSFALYEGNHGKGFSPYQASVTFPPTDHHDRKLIAMSRKSLVRSQVVSGSQVPSFMREISNEERCTVICKVLHIHTDPKGEWCAFIWDGTNAPPLPMLNKLEDEVSKPLPLQLETFALSMKTLRSFPLLGTILRMVVAKGMEVDISSLVCNRWFKMMNIILEVHSGLWHAAIMTFTRLLDLPSEDPMTIERERNYRERVSCHLGVMPSWPLPPPILVTGHESVGFVTLRAVLTHKSVTAKFKCVVRVLALTPWRVTDFRNAKGTYRLRLTVEDATTRVHAYVCAEDGQYLFGHNPTMAELSSKRNKLLGISDDDVNSNRDPPWCKCSIKSYYVDKKDPWGSRHFRISDLQV